jgi:TPR repeat protein
MWRIDLITMTKHLTKPIRAIHFMVLALLMTLSSSVMAQDFQKGLAAFQAGDFATALQEWTPLAEAGDATPQFVLGLMYSNGEGVPKDYAEAMKWFRLAAEQGDAAALKNLGVMYEDGKGVPKDYAEAAKWYRLAAEQGEAFAQATLGFMHQYGRGVPQDNVMSHIWYNIASANGDENTGEWRDELEVLMTPADISKAQAMAGECMNSGYTKCGY